MPSYKLTASWPVLDRERYLRDYKAAINKAIILAARKFLLAAVPKIPVFTGMARGALGNLEDIAGRVQGTRVRGTLKGVTKEKLLQKKKFYYYPPGKPRVLRTNIAGRQFATTPNKILNEGRLTSVSVGSRMIFKFSVDITYFDYLDKNKWHAFEAGRQAFNAELKTQLDRLTPKIGKYFIRREIK